MKNSFTIREAIVVDVPALAQLHVRNFIDAFPDHRQLPAVSTRQWQWAEQFKIDTENWFCTVAENPEGELIGFAKGLRYSHNNLPANGGELNKIYVLRDCHGQGIARRLFEASVKKFRSMNITSFVVFGAGTGIANSFYERMGGEKLFAKNVEFHVGFG